jgi:hypothetical protein
MKLNKFLNEDIYNSWSFPSESTMKEDFREYEKKENTKWLRRVDIIGARFPIFENYKHFKNSLKGARVVTITDSLDRKINNRSRTSSIEELEDLVSNYKRPRDVKRIERGIENNEKIPYPIILKGSRDMWIMAGNTRLDVAFIKGVIPKALMVDISK